MDLKYYNINSQLSGLINRILEELCKTYNYSPELFSDKNKEFLIRYSILKDISSVNKLLNELEEKPNTYDAFFEGNRHVKCARDYINDIYSRYISTPERKKGFESFEKFLEWWFKPQNYPDGKKVCHYCGIDEDTAKEIFVSRTISSKKFTGTLHIDRKDPDGGYNPGNCVFACSICNNTKSDMMSDKDFEKYFKDSIIRFWEEKKEEFKKINSL